MSKTLPERLRDAARKLRTSSMPLSDYIPLLQQAADALESRAMSKTLPPLPALPPAPQASLEQQEPVAWLHQCRKKPDLRELLFKKVCADLKAKG